MRQRFGIFHWMNGFRLRTNPMTHSDSLQVLFSTPSPAISRCPTFLERTHSSRRAHTHTHRTQTNTPKISFLMTFIDFCCCFVRFSLPFFPDLCCKKHTHTKLYRTRFQFSSLSLSLSFVSLFSSDAPPHLRLKYLFSKFGLHSHLQMIPK